jgi:short-subunit dehydrogenase
MTMESLKGKNIVITGASSGIGKATALSLARLGANLVLGSRRELLLEEVASECRQFGVKAYAFKTDVTLLDSVQNLLEFALSHLGVVDIWINNAGVGAIGEFTQTPMAVHERVIKTNLVGYMYGAYVVIPYFKDQKRGQLINNISLGAFVPNPFAVSYSASKFGLRGFSEALRYELHEFHNIHVCDLFPAFIDTPGFVHGANFVGRQLRPASPVYDPYLVANSIVSICQHPRDRVMVGASGKVAKLIHALTPRLLGNMMARMIETYLKKAENVPITEGNLFKPVWRGAGTHGGWRALKPLKKGLQKLRHSH